MRPGIFLPLLLLSALAGDVPPPPPIRPEPDPEPEPEPMPDPLVEHLVERRIAVESSFDRRDVVVVRGEPSRRHAIAVDHAERPKRPPTAAEVAAEDKRRKRAERNARHVAAGGIKAAR
jgi:hypothetical protein